MQQNLNGPQFNRKKLPIKHCSTRVIVFAATVCVSVFGS